MNLILIDIDVILKKYTSFFNKFNDRKKEIAIDVKLSAVLASISVPISLESK